MIGTGQWLLLVAATLWAVAGHAQTGQPAQAPSANEFIAATKTFHAIREIMKAKREEAKACIDAELASDEAKPILSRIQPIGEGAAAEAQFADGSLITSAEIRAFKRVAPKLRACREIYDNAQTSYVAAEGPISSDFETRHAALIGALIARKLTWGEYYKQNTALKQEVKERKAAIVRGLKEGSYDPNAVSEVK